MRRFISSLLIAFIAIPAPAFASWRFNFIPWRERRQDDVAAVQVAVQSIAPFEDYIESLQPHFELSPAEAVNEAIAQTRTQDTVEFRALMAALNVAGPSLTRSSDKQTQVAADGTTTSTSTSTASERPGAQGDVSAPAAATRQLAAALPTDNGSTKIDPSMKYNAATTLIQRLALLSTYVRDAAVRQRTKPFLVRMLVTVLPSAATRGYDAYTTISFFSTGTGPDGTPLKAEMRVSAPAYALENYSKPDPAKQYEASNQQVMRAAYATACDETPLETIPLLVTDTVSSSLHSDSLEQMRDLAVALQGMASNAKVGAGVRSQKDRIDKTLTSNFNGVMTVSRVAQNSMEVRLGAMFGNREDALVPRTYDVTALVLFPIADPVGEGAGRDTASSDVVPCSVATYTAQTTFRNSQNGKMARPTRQKLLLGQVRDFLGNEGLPTDIADSLIEAAQSGNYAKFKKAIKKDDPALAPLLWSRVMSVVARYSFSRGSFQAPARQVVFFPPSINGTVFDDGKSAKLTLVGAKNILSDRVIGMLTIEGLARSGGGTVRIHLPATAVDGGRDGRIATLTFDSASKYLAEVLSLSAEVSYAQGARDWERNVPIEAWRASSAPDAATSLTYVSRKRDAPASRFSVRTGTSKILVKNGAGSLTVSLTRNPEEKMFPMLLFVEGADVANAGTLTAIGSNLGSFADGTWKITLENVTGSNVTLHAFSLREDQRINEPDVVLDVQPGT